MYVVFYSTSDVFKAEEKLNNAKISCRVVPTPVQDKAYCGVCIEINNDIDINIIADMEYKIVD